ncbi:hypothetical protein [Sphingopyxis kveilinensis]|uniref:hypothetical protein n=1 Tax=Sphingopyxis kveilinensis TaxID=3114367 RepID=UPI0030CBD563
MTPPVATPAPKTTPTAPETGPATIAPPVVQSTQPAQSQPVIRVPLDIAPAEPAPAEAEPAVPARAERSARQAPVASTAAPAAATSGAEPAPSEPLGEAVAAPVSDRPIAAPAEPVTAEAQPTAPAEFPWELVGGAAALIALGGAGLMFARRRRVEPDAVETAAPLASTMPAGRTPDQPWVTPAYTAAPVRSTPAFAAAPSGSMGRHEAMAMAGPTPDNPFLTLSKRLKRARFFDRQERLAYAATLGAQKDMTRRPVSAWEIAQREAPAAAQQQEVRRPEPARGYRGLRPGLSRP